MKYLTILLNVLPTFFIIFTPNSFAENLAIKESLYKCASYYRTIEFDLSSSGLNNILVKAEKGDGWIPNKSEDLTVKKIRQLDWDRLPYSIKRHHAIEDARNRFHLEINLSSGHTLILLAFDHHRKNLKDEAFLSGPGIVNEISFVCPKSLYESLLNYLE